MVVTTPGFASITGGLREPPLPEIPAYTFARSMDVCSSGELTFCFVYGVSVRL
jgi:hypothetical protein